MNFVLLIWESRNSNTGYQNDYHVYSSFNNSSNYRTSNILVESIEDKTYITEIYLVL